MFILKGEPYRKDVSMSIPLNNTLEFSTLRKRQLKRASQNDLRINLETDLTSFWNNILIPNLKTKHHTIPTHSLNEIKKLQALVGVKTDGNYGPQTAKKVDQFRISQQAEKKKLVNIVENIRTSIDTSIVEQARVEIKRLRTIADRDVQKSQTTITRLRSQLDRVAEIDNTTKILELRNIVQETETNISTSLDNKFQLETEVRVLEAEVGPIKYIAELVYGNTERNTIDDAVRWLIIVFIFVFDPLAVLLLIAANYSFKNRNDNDSSQEEIFDALFAKKDKKKLDIASNIDDTGVEETKEDITRKLNTSLVKRHGWLDKK